MQDNADAQKKPKSTGLSKLIVPVGIFVFCAYAFWLSTQFDRVPPILKRGIQPSDFPQLVILLIVALTAWLLFRDKDKAPQRLSGIAMTTIGLLIGFVLIATIDLFLALGVFAASLTMVWGERRIWAISLVGLVTPLAVFFFFDTIFEVRFPRGILTNLWYG